MRGMTASANRVLHKRVALALVVLWFSSAPALLSENLEISAQELVSRHIQSIGTPAALAQARFRVAQGICTGRGRAFAQAGAEDGSLGGETEFVTGPNLMQFTIVFANKFYPVEGFRFDGEEVRLSAYESPTLSGLGDKKPNLGQLTTYFPRWKEYIQRGLFGGVLNTWWPLLKLDEHLDEIESPELREVDGRELLALRFEVPGSMGAELFFEPGTFRHVASRFRLLRTSSASLRDSRQWVTLREEFGDFDEFDGMQLPIRWTIILELSQDTPQWEITFDSIRHLEKPELKRSVR